MEILLMKVNSLLSVVWLFGIEVLTHNSQTTHTQSCPLQFRFFFQLVLIDSIFDYRVWIRTSRKYLRSCVFRNKQIYIQYVCHKKNNKKKDRIQQLNQQIFNFKKSKVDEYTKLYEKNNNIEVMKKYITSLYIIIYFTILF